MAQENGTDPGLVVVVTGGSGFLGKAVLNELMEEDSPLKVKEVRNFDLKEDGLHHGPRLKYIHGDVRDVQQLKAAFAGADMVLHTAAIVDWGTHSEQEVMAVNTDGTENVVRACREAGVNYLVYTSSLDAVYSGKPLVDVDETLDYPEKHETSYCRSKYLGEKIVVEANSDTLKTCVLRPSDIYGENDPYHMDSLIDMVKGGIYVRLGDGSTRTQHVYVNNMAHAHLVAGKALMSGNEKIAGSVYFITDGPGANFFKFFDQIVEGAGYKIRPKNLWLPRGLAYSMGSISEGIAWLIRPIKKYNPKFSRFAVTYTCTNYTFSARKARDEFGWQPKYTEEQAIQRTIEYYRAKREQAR